MSGRAKNITLRDLPVELLDHAFAEAKALSAEVGGPEIRTHREAVRALFLFGLNTATIQRSIAERVPLEHVKLDS